MMREIQPSLPGAPLDSAEMSQMAVHSEDRSISVVPAGQAGAGEMPEGVYDVNGQQLDLRRVNSWLLKLGEVETVEAAEVCRDQRDEMQVGSDSGCG